jgi:hypothetical protein
MVGAGTRAEEPEAPTIHKARITSHGEMPRTVARVGGTSPMVGACSVARSGPEDAEPLRGGTEGEAEEE